MNEELTFTEAHAVLNRLAGKDVKKSWPFWYNGVDTVYYAKGWQDAKGNFWPSVFNLIQCVGCYHRYPRYKEIFVPPNIRITPICQGAIDFYSMEVTRLKKRTREWEESHLHDKKLVDQVGRLQLVEFKLDDPNFSAVQKMIPAGASPKVDLGGERQTHLHRLYMAYAYEVTEKKAGHRIGAVAANRDGVIQSIGVNQRQRNATFHAEIVLLMLWGRLARFSEDVFFVYTTLKPCKMCAAAINYHLPNSRIFYNQDDPNQKDTQSPAHGTFKLSGACTWPDTDRSKGMKPVRHARKEDLSAALEVLYKRPYATVTNILNSDKGGELIGKVKDFLTGKAKKYRNPTKKTKYGLDDVRRVLVYLGKLPK